MEISQLINSELWANIKDNYESKNYTSAITNSMIYLNEVVKEKSGIEGLDNTKLMNEAFSQKNPKLLVNKNQTQSEKDIQIGVGEIARGLCHAIRNPRSHERYKDDETTANKIILFIDYILGFIRDYQSPNLVEDWVEFILDKHFNSSKKNADDVFSQIPKQKRYDVLVGIYRKRELICDDCNLANILNLLFNSIDEDSKKELLDSINKELISADINDKLKAFFRIFPKSMWSQINPLAKNRIEGMALKSVQNADGTYSSNDYPNYHESYSGYSDEASLAVWCKDFIEVFSNKSEIDEAIIDKMLGSNYSKTEFINEEYLSVVKNIDKALLLEKIDSHYSFIADLSKDSLQYTILRRRLSPKELEKYLAPVKNEESSSEEDDLPF